jgi:CheY-like chemotaxis protein
MAPVTTAQLARFVLHLAGREEAALWYTEFFHPSYAPTGYRIFRGQDEGAHVAQGSFQWTGAVQVLVAYLLRCAAWGRRGAHLNCPSLTGKKGTPAASLAYAMSKKPQWVRDMFGTDANGTPHLLYLFKRSNADLKREGEPVVLCLDQAVLPATQIEVVAGDRVEDPEQLEQIATGIEASWKPRAKRGRTARATTPTAVTVTIEGHLPDWTSEKEREFLSYLDRFGIGHAHIIRREQGSIKLTLKLPPEEAERLFWAFHCGELDELDVIDCGYSKLSDPDRVKSLTTSTCLLLVDDEPAAAMIVARLAQRLGVATTCAGDGSSAWAHLSQERPDLVLLDVHLPGSNGIELLRRIRTSIDPPRLPVALFCQPAQVDDVAAGWRAGADYLLAKDLLGRPEAWMERLKEILAHARGQASPGSLTRPASASGPVVYDWATVLEKMLRSREARALGEALPEVVLRRALDRAFAVDFSEEELARWIVAGQGRLDRRVLPRRVPREPLRVCFASLVDQWRCLLGNEASMPLVQALQAATF